MTNRLTILTLAAALAAAPDLPAGTYVWTGEIWGQTRFFRFFLRAD